MDHISADYRYCPSLIQYIRRKSRVVKIGNIPLGGKFPVRIQTMTNKPTLDTGACVEQCIKIAGSGADYVRLTARNIKEAENLARIKNRLIQKGIMIPLIADTHYHPEIAEIAAGIVEKVRINPGNFASNGRGSSAGPGKETDKDISRIRDRFISLLNICKKHGTSLRIGVNHGSLSGRILNSYGDTPLGMVTSAMEFVNICREENFHRLVLSCKSSNPLIMVHANRLLVSHLSEAGLDYPLHLGITEAGEGEDGRLKSAIGIGSLLSDGIGDTIRISLTEDPENEIPVAKKLLEPFHNRTEEKPVKTVKKPLINPFEYNRRQTVPVRNIGGTNPPVVIADFSRKSAFRPENFIETGYSYDPETDSWSAGDEAADFYYLGNLLPAQDSPELPGYIVEYQAWQSRGDVNRNIYPICSESDFFQAKKLSEELNFLSVDLSHPADDLVKHLSETCQPGKKSWPVLVLDPGNTAGPAKERSFILDLINRNYPGPVILKKTISDSDFEAFQLKCGTELGILLIDGLGDGIWLTGNNRFSFQEINRTAFGILQAARMRISRPDYISCPSCGRTLFDIQETNRQVRKATSHLKGLKIAIMGCIVNGPGEMADADYGYIGSGIGKVTLYKNRKMVKRGIPSQEAVAELINLIKECGDWIEPVDKMT